MGILSRVSPRSLDPPMTALSALALVSQLGQLSGFVLNDQTFASAGQDHFTRPPLPQSIGCCYPLIGVRNPNWKRFLLPAFVIPLQWSRESFQETAFDHRKTDIGHRHDRRLPAAIHHCADQVLATINPESLHEYSISLCGKAFVVAGHERL